MQHDTEHNRHRRWAAVPWLHRTEKGLRSATTTKKTWTNDKERGRKSETIPGGSKHTTNQCQPPEWRLKPAVRTAKLANANERANSTFYNDAVNQCSNGNVKTHRTQQYPPFPFRFCLLLHWQPARPSPLTLNHSPSFLNESPSVL